MILGVLTNTVKIPMNAYTSNKRESFYIRLEVGMAKKKKKSKSRRTKKANLSVEKSDPAEFPSYQEWIRNIPDWLNKIEHLIGCGYTKQAHQLLTEEEIQKNLVSIDDARIKVYVLHTVAVLLDETGQIERAAQYYTEMLDIPEISRVKELSALYRKAGLLWAECGRTTQALDHFNKADQLEPDNKDTLNLIAGSIMKIGRLEEAMDLLRKALTIDPQFKAGHSNLLLDYNYLPDGKSSEILAESKKWAQTQAPTSLAYTNHDNSLDAHRKLRIGYISPDFKHHSVTFFFESLLDGHDRNKFEIYGYGNVAKPDDRTEELIDKFDSYRDIYKVDDKEVVEFIRSDSIDILVDLAGHTGFNRLHVLGYKPAPIQVTYLGYPNTTGMTQVDYRLTDAIADTPDQQKYYTEKLVFLPNGFLCYNPGKRQPTVKALPISHKDYITFGCFNNINKLSLDIIKIWVDILNAVPNSKLILKFTQAKDSEVREYCYNRFAEYGLENPEERIMIFTWLPLSEHFELYNNVDIALDTYPYNGTTITCQALLMGVPVITLAGSRHSSRVGLDSLTRLEMQFFAAHTPEEYVKKAVALASKPEALTQIRKTMRQRLAASPLCNYELITDDIENAYRRMWHDYCRSKGIEIKQITSGQDTDYRPRRYAGRTVIDNIISADKFYQAGKRFKAAKYAMEAFNELPPDNNGEKPPQQLLERYNADDLQSLILNVCIEIMMFSSYFSPDNYCRIYSKAQEINPSNPEIDLRIGLLMALQARSKNVKIQDECIKLLEITNRKLNNERSKAVLALAKGDLKELSLPYDLARIHLHPDLKSITTYVLLEQGDWFEKSDLNFFRSIIRPDDTVFDLGANVGTYSLSAAARTNGKVIAVEPASETFELLNRSASQFSNMTAIHTAVSGKPGTAFLSHGGSSEKFKLSDNNEALDEKVPLVTVDDIAAEHGIESVDIIKMGVEGHELKALAGAEKVIGNGSPIIFYEVKQNGNLHTELIDAFKELGYDSYFTLPDAKKLVKYNRNIPIDGYLLTMIAIRPESLQRLEGLVDIEQSQADVLAKTRAQVPAAIAAGNLGNRERFAENVEEAYRQKWHRWRQSHKGVSPSDCIKRDKGTEIVVDGLNFTNIKTTKVGDISVGFNDKYVIKIEHGKHPWKLRTFSEEIEIIKYLNSRGCVSCPGLVSEGKLKNGERYFIQERFNNRQEFNAADMMFSILEQKSFGVCQGDFKRDNFIFDDDSVCHIIDYDQAIYDERFIDMNNVEYLEYFNRMFVDRWKKVGFNFADIYSFGGFKKEEVLGLFKNNSFNLAETSIFQEQITTNTDSGIYHSLNTDKVYIDGARSLDPRRAALDSIEFTKGEKILDVGCNMGLLGHYLHDRGCKVTGIDMDKKIVTGAKIVANLLNKDIQFKYLDLDTATIEEDYDTICLFSVIHHVANFQQVTENIAQRCNRIILECRLQEQGAKPVQGRWVRSSGWNFNCSQELIDYLETAFGGFKFQKYHGSVDRLREIMTFVKEPRMAASSLRD